MDYCRLLIEQDFLPVLVGLINTAEKEVLLTTFKIQRSAKPDGRKLMSIHKALEKAQGQGINVKILTNLHTGGSLSAHVNTGSARNLRKCGVEVRGPSKPRIIHAKICIIDSEAFILGSHNITTRALTKNHEVSILIKDKNLSRILRESFYALWAEAQD